MNKSLLLVIVQQCIWFLSQLKARKRREKLPVKSFWTVRVLMFFKEVSSAQKACIYLIQSRPTAKQYNFDIFHYLK